MRTSWPRPRFSAILTQSGIHLVAYRRNASGLHVVRSARDLTPTANPQEAIHRLGNLLESQGARGSRLAVAIGGFRSCHHILSLPPGPRELLAPVVARELRRFYPDIFAGGLDAPVVEFTESDAEGRNDGAPQEYLAAALPRELVAELQGSLERRGIVLEHLTILPRAVQHLYRAFSDPQTATAALLMVPGDPLLGFFHEGELRLFSAPMLGEEASSAVVMEAVAEQIERGSLFIRQQFRGATIQRILLSADPEMSGVLVPELTSRLGATVERFSPYGDSPGSLAALGAALDAISDQPFNLLPADLRPRSPTAAWVRALAVATAVVLVMASAWGTLTIARRADRQEDRVRSLAHLLDRRAAPLAEIRSVVRERQAHTQRAATLAELAADQERLPGLLWLIQNAPPEIGLDSVSLVRDGARWAGLVAGVSLASTSAQATMAIDELYRRLEQEYPPGSVLVRRLGAVPPPEEPDEGLVAIEFEISLTVTDGDD